MKSSTKMDKTVEKSTTDITNQLQLENAKLRQDNLELNAKLAQLERHLQCLQALALGNLQEPSPRRKMNAVAPLTEITTPRAGNGHSKSNQFSSNDSDEVVSLLSGSAFFPTIEEKREPKTKNGAPCDASGTKGDNETLTTVVGDDDST
eukprot:CAMPEP_0168825554 /NCGR_PEP_ID=MMETSP0726-20121227/11697_1 /TAXON_ID=265536 /ORGANISM="Amphiprora sp., Strain CCMP467" /LENGTH=148 /DNA_ID=CAMNT_0008878645 /DNA_START=154 /DNA_END=597 /DNA_ORIENTATION=-